MSETIYCITEDSTPEVLPSTREERKGAMPKHFTFGVEGEKICVDQVTLK
jgi:hypothetical protein